MEQVRVDDGIWMPERVEGHAAAKILFVNSLVVERTLTYSEYKPPQPGYARREMIRRFRWLHGAGGKDCGEY
jgi:hypothetical protein